MCVYYFPQFIKTFEQWLFANINFQSRGSLWSEDWIYNTLNELEKKTLGTSQMKGRKLFL